MGTCITCRFSAMEDILVPTSFGSISGVEKVRVCRLNPPTLPNALLSERLPQTASSMLPVNLLAVHRATFPIVSDSMFCGQYVAV